AAWLMPPATWATNRILVGDASQDSELVWSAAAVRLFGVAAVVLALFGLFTTGPQRVEWAIGVLVVIAARNVWIAWYERRRGSMWLAAVLFQLAANMWWANFGSGWWGATGPGASGEELEFLWVNAIALAALGLVSVCVEYWRIAPSVDESLQRRGIAL